MRSEQRVQEEYQKAHTSAFQVQKMSQKDQLWKSCNYISGSIHTFSKWWNSWSHGDLRISLSNRSFNGAVCCFMARSIRFDALQRTKSCPLVAMRSGWNFWGIEGKGHMSYLSRHDYFSTPGLAEHRTMHLWFQCWWILNAASVAEWRWFCSKTWWVVDRHGYKGGLILISCKDQANYRDVKWRPET